MGARPSDYSLAFATFFYMDSAWAANFQFLVDWNTSFFATACATSQ
jgi:hypothetical protein